MVREGYKQTEVGVIPEDWEISLLGEACAFLDGQRRPVKSSDRAKMQGAYPYYGASGVVDFVDNYLFDGEFILLGEDGENILSRNLPLAFQVSGKIWVNNHAHILEPKADFEIGYLTNFLESLDYRLLNSGTAQPKLNKKTCEKIRVAKPKLVEQKAIAEALSDVDGLIASLEALIEKKLALKTAAMQQLLTGKTRLGGFGAGKGMKQTELGEIPEDWDVVPLGEIGKPVIGLTYKPSDVSDEGTLVLRSSNIQDGALAYENNVFVKHDVPQRVITCEEDLLICVRNGSRSLIGKCALIDLKAAGSAFGAFMSLFKSDESKFVYFQFQSRVIKKQIEDTMGATINQITNKDLNRFCIPFPKNEQERGKITEILSDLELEAQSLVSRLSKTKALKQGMMQELLTGRTRLV